MSCFPLSSRLTRGLLTPFQVVGDKTGILSINIATTSTSPARSCSFAMVSLEQIRLSNSEVAASLPPNVVAVFAGATAGIGEATLKQFAKNAIKPRIYFIGRSKTSGNRILADLRQLNPEGEYIYLSVDVSVLEEVDRVCLKIKEKETAINLLFLSTGTMITGKGENVWRQASLPL